MSEPQVGYIIPGSGDSLSLSCRLRIINSVYHIEKMFEKTKDGDFKWQSIRRTIRTFSSDRYIESITLIPIPLPDVEIFALCDNLQLLYSREYIDKAYRIVIRKPFSYEKIDLNITKGTYDNSIHEYTQKLSEVPIDSKNKGYEILNRIGWNGGGLGKKEQGIKEPINILKRKRRESHQMRKKVKFEGKHVIFDESKE